LTLESSEAAVISANSSGCAAAFEASEIDYEDEFEYDWKRGTIRRERGTTALSRRGGTILAQLVEYFDRGGERIRADREVLLAIVP
jgi:hypothetical protein